ncbi:MAG TPA: ATP-binding protein, partial [Steroidobacteraceae bacterium]|nr:ATP-binding protein [Steroidobacteraceae bacterium]
VRVIRDGSRSMDDMVVGLLAFSRASRQPLQLVQLDMTPIVHSVVRETRALYPDSKAEVDIGELPPAAADPTVIRHVWSNLIGNAFKYSARRTPPQIRISGVVAEDEAVYMVQDNGAGFDMRYAEKLFGVFKRLHNASDFPGTGVGLAIVHRIVSRHGGRVWAESAPDAGACFRFSLPAGLRS